MKITEVKERTPLLIQKLLAVWESAVKATHLFLSDTEINEIKEYVPEALKEVKHLIAVNDEDENPVAFMGIEENKLEMLFVSDGERGKGIGKDLIKYAIDRYFVNEVAVNEQNPLAKGFYEHMGFQVYKRTDYDEQGNPYPILYMKLWQ